MITPGHFYLVISRENHMTNKIIGAAILIMLISFPFCPLNTNSGLRKEAGNGNTRTVELLLGIGANPNAKRHDGITALMRASNRGQDRKSVV